ncbi:MAG: 6-bladed beta-propeller [Verrucomicrobiota bacterium]
MTITKLSAISLFAATLAGHAQYQPMNPPEEFPEEEIILGHNDLKYRVVFDWAKADREVAPVCNAHAMVEGSDGLFYLVTDHPKNAILVFQPDGTFIKAFGENLKGGHGIDVIQDGDRELLIHVDCGWDFSFSESDKPLKKYGSVNLFTKDGELVRTLPSPIELGLEEEGSFYGPCDVAVTPSNTILVVDGYGTDRVFEFTLAGELVRHWGGKKEGDPASVENGHGISIDLSVEPPVVWVSSRAENKLKTFTLEGQHLETLDLPGAWAGQAVFHGDHIYTGVCWSNKPDGKRGWQSGFVAVLDRKTRKVLSVPGGTAPVYENGQLQNLAQTDKIFKHVHDLMLDKQGNIYVMEWNASCRYPIKLELIQ